MQLKILFSLAIVSCFLCACANNNNTEKVAEKNIATAANLSNSDAIKIDSSVVFNLDKMIGAKSSILLIEANDLKAWKSKKVKYCDIAFNIKSMAIKGNQYVWNDTILQAQNVNNKLNLSLGKETFQVLDNEIIFSAKTYIPFDENIDIIGKYTMKSSNGETKTITFEKNNKLLGLNSYAYFKFYNKNETADRCEWLTEEKYPWVIKFTASTLKKDVNTIALFDENIAIDMNDYDNIFDTKDAIYLVKYDGKSTYQFYNIDNESKIRQMGYSDEQIMDLGTFIISGPIEKGKLAFELTRQ